MSISHWKQQLRQIKEHTMERSRSGAEKVIESIESIMQFGDKKAYVPSPLDVSPLPSPQEIPSSDSTLATETVDHLLYEGMQILIAPDPYAESMAALELRWKEIQQQRWKIWEQKRQQREQQYQNYLEKLHQMSTELSWMDPASSLLSSMQELQQKIQTDLDKLIHFHHDIHRAVEKHITPPTATQSDLPSPTIAKEYAVPAHTGDHRPSSHLSQPSSPPPPIHQVQPEILSPPLPKIEETPNLGITAKEASCLIAEPQPTENAQPSILSTMPESESNAASAPSAASAPNAASASKSGPEAELESSLSPWERWTRLGPAALIQHPDLKNDVSCTKFAEKILSASDPSSIRCVVNELQQARKRFAREQWDMLLSLLALRMAQLDQHFSLCSQFPPVHQALRQLWAVVGSEKLRERSRLKQEPTTQQETYKRGGDSSSIRLTSREPSSVLKPKPGQEEGSNDAKRVKKRLPPELKKYVDELEQIIFEDQLNQLTYLSDEERFLYLESLGIRARWVQDNLPSEEKESPYICSWFGIIRSAREKWCPDHWLSSLNRHFIPPNGWSSALQDLQAKLEKLQQTQREDLEKELTLLEDTRRQRLGMLESFARLKKLSTSLDPSGSPDHPEAKKFLDILGQLLDSNMLSSSHPELLHLAAPFANWLAEGKTFRSLRKHLRKRQDSDTSETEAPITVAHLPFDESDWQEEAAVQPVTEDAMTSLLNQILPQTRGLRALIVGGDEREEKRQRLQQRLQLKSLIWIPSEEGRIRKIEQAASRMESGQIELLILLLGFCGHSKVNRLIQTAKRHDVLCVPVDHGHGEVRVIRRIAYYLGYLESSDMMLRS